MNRVLENILAVSIAGSLLYLMYKIIEDIVKMEEKRPVVTDEMIEEAFQRDVMSKSDSEMDDMDWLSDDDD